MSQDSQRTPSVGSLATALSAVDPVAAPPQLRIAIARPPPRERALIGVLLIALPLVAIATGVLAVALWRLHVATVEDLHDRQRRAREELPAAAVLLDATAWRREAAGRPLAAANLLLGRCRLLAAAGRWQELADSVASVALVDPGGVLPATRLLQAEALLALGRPDAAAAQLHGLGAGLDEAGRARLADLSARAWAAAAPRPASALRPAEQPHEAAPE